MCETNGICILFDCSEDEIFSFEEVVGYCDAEKHFTMKLCRWPAKANHKINIYLVISHRKKRIFLKITIRRLMNWLRRVICRKIELQPIEFNQRTFRTDWLTFFADCSFRIKNFNRDTRQRNIRCYAICNLWKFMLRMERGTWKNFTFAA